MSARTDQEKMLAKLECAKILSFRQAQDCGIKSPTSSAAQLQKRGHAVEICFRLVKPAKGFK